MADSENVWEGQTAGVEIVRASLLLRLADGQDEAGQLLEEMKGTYLKKVKGWLIDYRNLQTSPSNQSGSWVDVEGEFAVFKPVRGLQISTTFMNLEGGQALCGVVVRITIINFIIPIYNSIPTLIYCCPTVKMNQRQIVVYHNKTRGEILLHALRLETVAGLSM